MKKDRKQDLKQRIAEEIHLQHIPGILGGVCVNGIETEYFSDGKADLHTNMEMRKDTIFRIYSMSKPVCAVAAWILIERGQLHLEDRVGEYLPEYREITCLQQGKIVPSPRPLQIYHLLNMTAGLTYDGEDEVGRRVGRFLEEIHHQMDKGRPISTREIILRLAAYPLAFAPGERWHYGLCADVLGAVIEVISGQSLDQFYQEQIFGPLKMKDTGFYVPAEKQDRFAVLYKQVIKDGDESCTLEEDREHHLGLGDFKNPPAFASAGAGLVSTYDDYTQFVQMLAGGGERNGIRILSPETIKQFMQNPLNKAQTDSIYFEHLKGYGYGNLMRVCLNEEEALIPGEIGTFGWDGWCGPYMAVDPRHKKSVLLFTQLAAYSHWDLNVQILSALV